MKHCTHTAWNKGSIWYQNGDQDVPKGASHELTFVDVGIHNYTCTQCHMWWAYSVEGEDLAEFNNAILEATSDN